MINAAYDDNEIYETIETNRKHIEKCRAQNELIENSNFSDETKAQIILQNMETILKCSGIIDGLTFVINNSIEITNYQTN